MKKVRIAMLLYVAVGLIPLAVLSTYAGPRLKRDLVEELREEQFRSGEQAERNQEAAGRDIRAFLRQELIREFTEFQHWRAPLNVQSQAPSVVRSPLADEPSNPLVSFYFQLRSDGRGIQYSTPHFPEGEQAQLESYQSQAKLPSGFEGVVREGCAKLKNELPLLLEAPVDGQAPPEGDLLSRFLAVRSGARPAAIQSIANDVLIVNSNAQEVANQARNAQVQKRANKKDSIEDPWANLKRPPGIEDPYGDSLVQVYPYQVYARPGKSPAMIFWRTVRTPAEQILQGFVVDTEYGQNAWAKHHFGENRGRGWLGVDGPIINFPIGGHFVEGGGETWLWLAFGVSKGAPVDLAAIYKRYDDSRNMYLVLGTGYAFLLALLGLFLHRTVSRSEALAAQQGEFVAAVSHELRTPLTAMRLFTELLIGQAKSAKNAKVEEHASRILAEEERLTRLVEMILLAAKIERGSFKVEIADSPLGETLGAAIDAALRAHAGREVTNEARDLPIVKQDRAAAQQVFFNLIDNALKYSRDAGKPVRVSSETKDGKLILRIIDQGAGIDEYDKKRLFERFARGTKANEQGAGTGLGLWLTREYAKQMGWEVTLESKPGEGTTAIVEIPF